MIVSQGACGYFKVQHAVPYCSSTESDCFTCLQRVVRADDFGWCLHRACFSGNRPRLHVCSGLKKPIFSAGNDLGELFAPGTSRERYKRFWAVSQEFLCQLYLSPLVTVAAIRGACASHSWSDVRLLQTAHCLTFWKLYVVLDLLSRVHDHGQFGQSQDVVSTALPAIILCIFAVPSFAPLHGIDEIVQPMLSLKAIGWQW